MMQPLSKPLSSLRDITMKHHITIFLLSTIVAVLSCNLPFSTLEQPETGSGEIDPDVEITDAASAIR
jgi:hypothetical protein